MPHVSLREVRQSLRDRRSTDRYVDALLVVRDHAGAEVFRAGGRWDRRMRAYTGEPCQPLEVRLQESQQDIARAAARWFEAVDRGNTQRARVIIAGGERGSGKTWFLAGPFLVAVALRWPGDWQFGVNLTSPQRRECVEAIREASRPDWIEYASDDLRDPFMRFVTGSMVGWASAQNPKRLRQAKLPIRNVLLNEGQDQAERNFTNAIGAIRNVGGVVTIATNPPQAGAGDWVATLWNAIESEEIGRRGEIYHLDAKLNRAVDQDALGDIGVILNAVNPDAALADAGGAMKLSGPIAYPNFRALPVHKGGHLGDPPPAPMLGRAPWRDITRERTAEAMHGGDGYDWIIGSDFQRRPGIVGVACKLFEVVDVWEDDPLPVGTVVVWAGDQINCPGDEGAFSDALERKGYAQNRAMPGASALLIGDGTGARQNAAHRFELPPSFQALKTDGWNIVPPRYTRKRKPENPSVKESRAQMWEILNGGAYAIRVSPSLKKGEEGFYSLVSSLQRAKVNTNGNLVGGSHHAPDGLRYVCWWAGPKPQPPRSSPTTDDQFNAVRALRLLSGDT